MLEIIVAPLTASLGGHAMETDKQWHEGDRDRAEIDTTLDRMG